MRSFSQRWVIGVAIICLASSLGCSLVRQVIKPRVWVASPQESSDPQQLATVTRTRTPRPIYTCLQVILLATLALVSFSIGLAHAQRTEGEGNDKSSLSLSAPLPLDVTGWGWSEKEKFLPELTPSIQTLDPVDCAVVETSVVGFETSKGQVPDDVSDFLNSIMAQGYSVGRVDISAGPIPTCVNILVGHGLAQNVSLAASYTVIEALMLKDWVRSGHGLMLAGDWGDFKTETQALFQAYGYSQLGGVVRDPTDFDPAGPAIDPAIWAIYQTDNFANHPILDGATSLQLQASSWLAPDTKAIVTADADAQPAAVPVMAAFTDGAGCVVLITDSNWYATDGGEGGYLKQDNARVARQMVKWLNGCTTLTLTKFATPSPVLAGQVLTYTLTVANNYDSLLTDVLITDVVPTNTSFVAATYPHNGPNASSVITWSLDILDISALAVVTMVVQVNSVVPTGTFIINTAGVTSNEGLADTTMAMVEVLAFTSTPTPTNTPIPTPTNTPIPTNTPTPAPTSIKSYLPLIIHTPLTFPLFIGHAIPVRSVAFQGETFYITTIQIPAQLPPAGSFYLSSEPDQVSPVLVDDDLVILLNDIEHFTYHFSPGGLVPQPAIVEVPRETMEQLAGQTAIVQYRDVYGHVVEASPMWLIWVR